MNTYISIIINQEQPWTMLMIHESNEITCFSWITNLISKQTYTKTLPNTILTNQNLGETKENDEREARERRRCREKEEREDAHLGFCAKSDVFHPSHVFI